MIAQRIRPRFTVRLDVPRTGTLRAWGAVAEDFERSLAQQVSPVVSEARVETETRRGPDRVRIRILVTARAADVGQAAVIAWDVFRVAAGDDIGAWDVNAATAQVRPAETARLAQRLSSRPPVETGGDFPVPQHLDLPFPLPAADSHMPTIKVAN